MGCQGKEIDFKDLRTPEQMALMQALGPYLLQGINQGATPFPGQLSAGFDPAQISAMNVMMQHGGQGPYQAPGMPTTPMAPPPMPGVGPYDPPKGGGYGDWGGSGYGGGGSGGGGSWRPGDQGRPMDPPGGQHTREPWDPGSDWKRPGRPPGRTPVIPVGNPDGPMPPVPPNPPAPPPRDPEPSSPGIGEKLVLAALP